ncbi:DUF4183 domain-containing protein [Amphibacillus cookii]|uniref:DUF4183 domain-containing protein n=1 Tax=Amphibacillus cookii TaxID=767787 RepID=UPI0019599872|nr:DUF4183 domain-containing protein [Amphibacillus cookii]MBM7542073.1 hypothetical protein [Amphibacillus cookii]
MNKHRIKGTQVYDWTKKNQCIKVSVPIRSALTVRAETYQYNARSDGEKYTYTNADELTEYGNRGILDPTKMTIVNLYVNGVLQPTNTYLVKEGELRFQTDHPPVAHAPIILQFVKLYLT